MSQPIEAEATPVFFHDCPMFGPHTRTIHTYMLSTDGKVQLGSQLKCLCGHTDGPFEPAPGVTVIGPHKYSVDMSKAILTRPAK